jgi:hypothetical protein
MPNRFELKQLREAAEKYKYHDADTHGAWPRLVWERRNQSPVARLDDAVEFLGKWKALRVKTGAMILSALGPARALLGVERSLLNLLSLKCSLKAIFLRNALDSCS